MHFPKYDGNVHPDEWINHLQKYDHFLCTNYHLNYLEMAITLVDSAIQLPAEPISDIEELRNALKKDISFTIFKNTNERMLQLLKYVPENRGGNTSKFISEFRKLCYNAEINDIEEQKKYLYKSLPMDYFDHFNSISNEFYRKMENIDSIYKLFKEFEEFVVYESKLITNESIVALKHVATGKYLSSISNLCYTTGNKSQMVFLESPNPGTNSLWKIKFNSNKELATYTNNSITLQHVKSKNFLGINYGYSHNCGMNYEYLHHKSPSTNYTEVSCIDIGNSNYWVKNWEFNYGKEGNRQSFLKSNDIINPSIKKTYDNNGKYIKSSHVEYLRSHNFQFTIGDGAFQEVVTHNERLGENDKWCIELIKQYTWNLD